MTNPNLTEIAVIMDCSGSMATIKNDMIGGFASFLEGQKKLPDPCVVSLYQFSNGWYTIFEELHIKDVQAISLTPAGGTALLDACAFSINRIGARLAAKLEEQRPGKVIVIIITDGEENASKLTTREQVADLIKTQQEQYNWQFLFLGANIDAFTVGGSMGFTKGAVANYQADSAGVRGVYEISEAAVMSYRSSKRSDAKLSFDPEEQKKNG